MTNVAEYSLTINVATSSLDLDGLESYPKAVGICVKPESPGVVVEDKRV